ncbi:MAG: twin-arginine translocase TatA/TatE family subunit [Flavobacteriales bacterium]|nr:twin-arginine translocase TatA/TatE family subunit [Flavobacteriales bacterium]
MTSLPLSILLGWVGPWQIILIVLVVLLLFGGKKIPELMRGLGQGMKEFKDASKDAKGEPKKEDGK